MRFAYYILAIYTMLLSCIPCQDELEVFADTHVAFSTADTSNQDQHILDLCSPFCICACCSGITLHQSIPVLPEVQLFVDLPEKTFAYSNRAGSSDLKSIWQPPRV